MKIIGHRGARALSPENTIASFEKAIEHGVDAIELDVRVSRDGVAVVHHDAAIINPDGSEVIIARTSYAELLRHKPDLAALDHVIRTVAHRCQIVIEIKPDVPTKQTVRIIRDRLKRGWQLKEFAVASFDFDALQHMREQLPGVQLIVNETWSGIRALRRARRLSTKRISMSELWLYAAYLRMMKRRGIQLIIFPPNRKFWFMRSSVVNSPERMKRWRKLVYGIVTDRPDLFEK
ncbi:MAG: glycerophosphodiester phosphodiesterase [Candidatus Saccharimonadales bacterium]|nr:glycerophosphodiester phosphodiesterase [Candidatus Saccharibacteria bacterium]